MTKNQIFVKKIIAKVGKTINKHNLIQANDKVLVALSGGKDSMVTLDILARRLQKIPINYELTALYVQLDGVKYMADTSYLEEFCKDRNVKFIIKKEKINLVEGNKSPCFFCSFNRRRILFQQMKQLGYNKLAFGHNLNDAVETFFMNIMFRNRISALPYKLSMFNGEFELIRPILELTEDDTRQYANIMNFKQMLIPCPYEKLSNRHTVRTLIEKNEKDYPGFLKNIFYSLHQIDNEYLPHKDSI